MNGIVESLISADTSLFLLLNSLHADWMDPVMWWLSHKWIWVVFYAALVGMLFYYKGWRKTTVALIFVALMIVIADQACSHMIRPFFERLRPSNPANPISPMVHIVNGYRGGAYGFPSCHAANTFALAVFLSLVMRMRGFTVFMLIWSVLISYSRIYLGVHYPGDILVGMMVGAIAAFICYYGYYMVNVALMRAKERNVSLMTYIRSLIGMD